MEHREIKFRAKHEPTGEWHYFSLADLFHGVKDSLRYSHWSQYTGLKDKNGTEIYEGDIVYSLSKMASSKSKMMKRIGKIVWSEIGWPHFQVANFNKSDYEVFDMPQSVDLSSIEVIGNIYDNPELKSKAA